jgi:hypothetical protein
MVTLLRRWAPFVLTLGSVFTPAIFDRVVKIARQ